MPEWLTDLLNAVVPIVATIALPLVLRYVATKMQAERFAMLRQFVQDLVPAIEQQMEGEAGETKLAYATSVAHRYAQQIGLSLTEEQIRTLIEAAVHGLGQFDDLLGPSREYQLEVEEGGDDIPF